MEFLSNYYIPVVLVFCLCIGYIMKSWLPTDNKIIPTVLFFVGAICGVLVLGVSFDAVVKGGFTGLAATGLHQAFKQFVDNSKYNDDEYMTDFRFTEEDRDLM